MVQFAFGSRFCVHFKVCLHPPTKMRSSPTPSSQVFESPVKEDSPLSVSLHVVPLASVSLFKFCVLCVLCRIRDELSYRHNPNISVMFSNSYSVSYKYTGNLGERINAFAFNLGLYFLSLFLSQKKQKEKRKKTPTPAHTVQLCLLKCSRSNSVWKLSVHTVNVWICIYLYARISTGFATYVDWLPLTSFQACWR